MKRPSRAAWRQRTTVPEGSGQGPAVPAGGAGRPPFAGGGWWACLVLGTAVASVFSGVLSNGFFDFDDYECFVDNPMVHGLGWTQLKWMFTSLHLTAYQPLAWLAGALLWTIAGPLPGPFHLLSLVLHIANAILLCVLLSRILERAAPSTEVRERLLAAGAASLLWSIHPTKAAAVAWATKVSDLMAAFFFLCACLSYLGRGQGRRPSAPTASEDGVGWSGRGQEQGRAWRPGIRASAWLFLASGLSHWTGIAFPLVLILLDFYPLKRLGADPVGWFKGPSAKVWFEKWPFLAIAIGLAVINGHGKAQVKGIELLYGLTHPMEASLAAAFYLRKVLFPTDLAVLYAINGPASSAGLNPGAAALLILVATLYAASVWRSAPLALGGWLFWLAGLLPSFASSAEGIIYGQDIYAYIPSMGLALLLAWALSSVMGFEGPAPSGDLPPLRQGPLSRMKRLLLLTMALGSTAAASAIFVPMSMRQTELWREPGAVWRQTLAADPDLWIAHYNLAALLVRQGRWDESRPHFQEALRLRPGAEGWKEDISAALRQMPSSSPGRKPGVPAK
ncbi:MAG: tetratricopeptide repeat protein [Elusimicrobia bacterium]|nr:tetratricopeptide repeat protein [Elusimicrobiota bacterium]